MVQLQPVAEAAQDPKNNGPGRSDVVPFWVCVVFSARISSTGLAMSELSKSVP